MISRIISLLVLVIMTSSPAFAELQVFKGITEPVKQATISGVQTGRVAVIHRKEGESVKKGDVILELEKEEQELETERRKLIAESKAELNSAQQQVRTLKRDYEATKQIFDTTQSVSEEELWKKELEYQLAVAENDRLKVAEERESLEYQISSTQLKSRLITAPFDGIVVKLHLQAGESCEVRDPLVRIVDISKCRFITYVDAAVSGLFQGRKVSLKINAGASPRIFQGVVEYAAPVVDPSSGLREVKVLFDNINGEIQPGVSGTMSLSLGVKREVKQEPDQKIKL